MHSQNRFLGHSYCDVFDTIIYTTLIISIVCKYSISMCSVALTTFGAVVLCQSLFESESSVRAYAYALQNFETMILIITLSSCPYKVNGFSSQF